MIDISLNGIEKYYGANKVLECVSFEVHSEDRIGIVGKNGCGKSTLFKIITGEEGYDKGNLAIRKGLNLGYLPQDSSIFNGMVVKELVNSGFEILNEIKEKIDILLLDLENNLDEYGELEDRYAKLGGYQREESLKRVLLGLKIDEKLLYKGFEELSGGEKSRIILAKTLLQNPKVLLLDEPTNHLDIDTVEWLEGFLRDYDGSIVIISHDRYFLDRVINKTVEIERGTAETYLTNYSDYLTEKRERLERQMEAFEQQQKQIEKMEDAIRRFRHWGANSDNEAMFKKAKNMEKRIEKLDKIELPKEDKKIRLSFQEEKKGNFRVLRVENLSRSFGEKNLYKNINFEIVKGEKVALIGKNGTGKTTLIKEIMENNNPSVKLGESVKVAYLDQICEFDDESLRVIDYFFNETELKEEELRPLLARYHFYGEDVFKKIGSLSGGEKSRLKLMVMITKGFNFLILDEPTNHLDISFKEVFEDTLTDFNGTVLFISHDRYFLNSVCQRIIELEGGKLWDYSGNYEYYKEKKLEKTKVISVNKIVYEKTGKKYSNNYIQNLEKELKEVEDKIEQFKGKLHTENDYNKLMDISKNIEILESKHDGLIEKWIEVEGC